MKWIFLSILFIFTAFYFLLILTLLISLALKELNSERFDDKWPPIDDDEFLRRCRPGTRRHTALFVRKAVSEHLAIPYEQVYPEQSFVDDLDVG